MTRKKKLIILGSTGSIGQNALKVVRHLSGTLEVTGIAAGSNVALLAAQAHEFGCSKVAVADASLYSKLKNKVPAHTAVYAGSKGIEDLIRESDDTDMVLCAIVGSASLMPVITAIETGKDIALASKEALVMAGSAVMNAAEKNNIRILPVDSEHSAIFQCLENKRHSDINRIILTASGGAFRTWTKKEMEKATLSDALAHPTWNMGAKVTIDSATLMNKALEIIEAKWLFDMPGEKIDVLIHHQSVIHSMVEFIDGTILAQMGTPDMRFPIQYALTYPEKYPGSLKPLDFTKFSTLSFAVPDKEKYPSISFAYEALKTGGTLPAVMNAANEIAVNRFQKGEISFTSIWKIIEKTMSLHKSLDRPPLDAILNADKEARQTAASIKV
jgi:1-deoxy-D-xylulose-5-phosphate reductoisomerase